MEFAFSVRQGNVFFGEEVTSCRASYCLNSKLKLKCRVISCNFLGNPRFILKGHQKTKLKKINSSSSIKNGLAKGAWESQLRVYHTHGSLFHNSVNILKLSRGITRLLCQDNDSVAHIDGNGHSVESIEYSNKEIDVDPVSREEVGEEEEAKGCPTLVELRELLEKALKELEVARVNSIMFEEKAQRISEAAIALKDEAEHAWHNVNSILPAIEDIMKEEYVAKEFVQKATMALSLAEARIQVAVGSLEAAEGKTDSLITSGDGSLEYDSGEEELSIFRKEEESLSVAQDDIRECQLSLANCEAELRRLESKRNELQKEMDRLHQVAEKAQINALKAEEDVANVMLLAEQAVALELEAAQRVNDAEIALQRAEKDLSISHVDIVETTVQQNGTSFQMQVLHEEELLEEGNTNQGSSGGIVIERDGDMPVEGASFLTETLPGSSVDGTSQTFEGSSLSHDSDKEEGKLNLEPSKDTEIDPEKSKNLSQTKKQELQKDLARDSSPFNGPKALLKKSSRFFSASFFSLDGTEFTPASLFHGLIESARNQLPKLVVGSLLFGAGIAFYVNRSDRIRQLFVQPDIITTSIDEVSSSTKPLVHQIRKLPKRVKKLIQKLPHQEVNEEEASLFDTLWLLLASIIFVPVFQKIPGGN